LSDEEISGLINPLTRLNAGDSHPKTNIPSVIAHMTLIRRKSQQTV